jgi:hypothetical protein
MLGDKIGDLSKVDKKNEFSEITFITTANNSK